MFSGRLTDAQPESGKTHPGQSAPGLHRRLRKAEARISELESNKLGLEHENARLRRRPPQKLPIPEHFSAMVIDRFCEHLARGMARKVSAEVPEMGRAAHACARHMHSLMKGGPPGPPFFVLRLFYTCRIIFKRILRCHRNEHMEDAMSTMDKIKIKIKALRARAEDSASSEHEAMAAISHADKLMKEHTLTVEDLEGAVLSGGINKGTWGKGTKKIHAVEFVAVAVTKLTETKGWIEYPEGKAQLVFLGFDADVEYALYLTDLVYNAMEAEWAVFKLGTAYSEAPTNRRGRMREDFMRGMAGRIRENMVQIVAERRTQMASPGTGTAAPTGTEVVVAKREMIAEAVGQLGIDPRKRRNTTKRVNPVAYHSGRAAGERTNSVRGIGA